MAILANLDRRQIPGNMIRILYILLLSTFVIGCNSSFDTDANIEAATIPDLNNKQIDQEKYIDASLKLMYPSIGSYEMKIDEDKINTEFKIGGNKFEVKFDSEGNWIKSEVGIRFKNKIPGKIRDGIKSSEFAEWFISDKTLIETPNSKQYKIEFQLDEEEWDIYFDKEGNIVQREKEIKKKINA